jgi:hypothetical protein
VEFDIRSINALQAMLLMVPRHLAAAQLLMVLKRGKLADIHVSLGPARLFSGQPGIF